MTQKTLKSLSYTALVGPALAIYAFFIIFPIFFSITLSFTKWSGLDIPKFVGLAQYKEIATDPIFLHGLRNNLWIVAVSVFGQIPLGFVLAYIIYRKLVLGSSFFEAMIFFPITISAVVVAILWNQIFSPTGIVTALMRSIYKNPRYIFKMFQSETYAIFPVLFVILWMYTGTYMVIFLANLQNISPSVIESAIIDGATEGQILKLIILPSMLNIIFTTIVFAISGSLKSFDLIYAMTGGGPAHYTEVIAIYMYINTFKYYKYGFGSAVSVIIIFLSLVLITFIRSIFNRLEHKYGA